MTILERDVGLTGGQRAVRRADDAAARCELLNAVGAPAGDTRNGEHGRVEIFRNAKHLIDEPGIKIDVGAYYFLVPRNFMERVRS